MGKLRVCCLFVGKVRKSSRTCSSRVITGGWRQASGMNDKLLISTGNRGLGCGEGGASEKAAACAARARKSNKKFTIYLLLEDRV